MKFHCLLLFAACFSFFSIQAQTNVSGGIYTNTTWTLANSPYFVTGDVVLFPGFSLTIEPGVEVRFSDGKFLEIRGDMIANGTVTDSIVFTSIQSKPDSLDWYGIKVMNTVGGSINLSYAVVKYSEEGVQVECCHGGGPLQASHSSFRYNSTAMSGYSGSTILFIDSCLFEYNHIAAHRADKNISNSLFRDNDIGVDMERTVLTNCEFRGHSQFAVATKGTVRDCWITDNNIGVNRYYTSLSNNGNLYSMEELTDNVITNNVIGIIVKENGVLTNSGNYFCGNLTYHVEKIGQENVNMTNNCWCEGDSALVAAKIYDGYDNTSLGLVDFTPMAFGCDTSVILSADQPEALIPSGLECYPNPVTSRMNIRFQSDHVGEVRIDVLSMNGRVVKRVIDQVLEAGHHQLRIDRENLADGIYFLRLQSGGGQEILKLVLM